MTGKIRFATEKDAEAILKIYAPYIEKTAITFEYEIPSLSEFSGRIAEIQKKYPWIVYEENGEILGYAYGSLPFERAAYRWSCEASIYLHPDAHRKGIGKQLYAALESLLRQQGYRKVYAIITTANEASVAFHQAVGYRHTATMPDCGYKLGNWYSVVWMEKDLNIWDAPPHEPIPIHRLAEL